MSSRRYFLMSLATAVGLTQLGSICKANSVNSPIIPSRLKRGDTVGLIAPAGFVDRQEMGPLNQTLARWGLQVKLGKHLFDRYGYLAGQDIDRVSDIHTMFSDRDIKAIFTVQGGWGCQRILPLLDYNLIKNNPKIIIGYSDITALLLAIYAQTGLITFHGPLGVSTWTPFAVNYLQKILFAGEQVTMINGVEDTPKVKQVKIPVEVVNSGKVKGRIIGGNLSVLAASIGSIYLPDWRNTILFLEDTGEEVYRVDRLLTQLKLAGILDKISGFIFGQCTYCDPEIPAESLSLSQVIAEHIKPLNIPAWYGSHIGHIADQFTLPLGVEVEIDADFGSIKMLESAVL